MNPFKILNLEPTEDKMAIRRAYVREAKQHHPDQGGNSEHFQDIQYAYELLVNNRYEPEVIESDVRLSLFDLMNGCIATAIIDIGEKNLLIEFRVPPYTYPGTSIEFYDKRSTYKKIRVTLLESHTNEYTRLDSSVVIRRSINKFEATVGIDLEIVNFDGNAHTVKASPNTTADRLIYHISGAGFFDKNSKVRGDLTIIVEVKIEGI